MPALARPKWPAEESNAPAGCAAVAAGTSCTLACAAPPAGRATVRPRLCSWCWGAAGTGARGRPASQAPISGRPTRPAAVPARGHARQGPKRKVSAPTQLRSRERSCLKWHLRSQTTQRPNRTPDAHRPVRLGQQRVRLCREMSTRRARRGCSPQSAPSACARPIIAPSAP